MQTYKEFMQTTSANNVLQVPIPGRTDSLESVWISNDVNICIAPIYVYNYFYVCKVENVENLLEIQWIVKYMQVIHNTIFVFRQWSDEYELQNIFLLNNSFTDRKHSKIIIIIMIISYFSSVGLRPGMPEALLEDWKTSEI